MGTRIGIQEELCDKEAVNQIETELIKQDSQGMHQVKDNVFQNPEESAGVSGHDVKIKDDLENDTEVISNETHPAPSNQP